MHFISWLVCIALLPTSMALSDPKAPSIKLSVWELPEGSSTAARGAGGIAFTSSDVPDMAMYLWVYEWNMFDAIKRGQHTQGTLLREKRLSADQTRALVASPDLKITFRARDDGADMRLVVTNNSDHDWPAIAGILP